MADLDDFFAKKDKKKNKTKKFLSTEELVKQLEQSAREKEASKNVKPAKIEEETSNEPTQNDDEWNTFEEEKRPDLSNLKLGQLNIDEGSDNRNYDENEENENSQFDGDSSENPWNKANSTPDEVIKKPEPVVQKTGAYIPTHLRDGAGQSRARSKKNAPDVQNEMQFPSLGTEKPVEPTRPSKKDGFEEVKHGGKSANVASGSVPVSIGNTYSSLLSDSLDS